MAWRFIAVSAVLPLMMACASITAPSGTEIELGQDSVVRSSQNGSASVPKKKGELLQLDKDAVFVESPGHVGVLVVPESGPGRLKINLKAIDGWGGEMFDRKLDATLDEVLTGVGQVFALIAAKKPGEALGRVEGLERRNPRIGYLKFLKASCLLLIGERARAKLALEEALALSPDNKEGQELYRTFTHERAPASEDHR